MPRFSFLKWNTLYILIVSYICFIADYSNVEADMYKNVTTLALFICRLQIFPNCSKLSPVLINRCNYILST